MNEVEVRDLALHLDARGWLVELCKEQPIDYVYATCCFPGAVKGWHRHVAHTDRLTCVAGAARVVAIQERYTARQWHKALLSGSAPANGRWGEFFEAVIGPLSPKLVVIPPGWWHGFAAVGGGPCVVVNCPDLPYDPSDEERLPLEAIPFPWREVSG